MEDNGQIGDAIQQWLNLVGQTAAVTGDSVRHKLLALQQLGRVLETHYQDESAEDALRQALDINPNQPEIAQHWIALRQRQCKWPVLAGWDAPTTRTITAQISPLSLAVASDDPVFQLARAHRYSRDVIGPAPTPLVTHATPPRSRKPGDKIRLGYVSSDLREHAVGFAMTDVMETHDRTAFHVSAYYCGIQRPDDTQARIKAAVDTWCDIRDMSDPAAAARIRADDIDILIDLNGYTKDARTKLFALRPAPVIVNWFGFPGTMGSPYHNYIIADDVIVPAGDEIFYTERVLRLPCYQPNDRRRTIASPRPSRTEVGLPDDAVVYCCFNGSQKITPEIVRLWADILAAVPGSVLWLLGSTPDTDQRLRLVAAAQGIEPARLVFADKLPNPAHLARYPLADLFLDNFPYGAHTTASDAMFMGVPVLTWPGNTFASRVCASLVAAAGLGELICDGPEDYRARAIELGRTPERRHRLRAELAERRLECTLFDTPRLVRELEALYRCMHDDHMAGRTPVPDLANLDAYFDLALDLAPTLPCPARRDDLLQSYRSRLAALHAAVGLPFDQRLLQKP